MNWIVILFAAVMAGIFAPKVTPYVMRWLKKAGLLKDEGNKDAGRNSDTTA